MVYKRLIEKYKSIRKQSYLNGLGKYRFSYAFAGVGHHSISNLYPCLESLRVPLKFIYSRDLSNALNLSKHFQDCTGTADFHDLLTQMLLEFLSVLNHLSIMICRKKHSKPGNMFLWKSHLVAPDRKWRTWSVPKKIAFAWLPCNDVFRRSTDSYESIVSQIMRTLIFIATAQAYTQKEIP